VKKGDKRKSECKRDRCYDGLGFNAGKRKKRLKQAREKRLAQPAQTETGQRNPKLAGRQISIQIIKNVLTNDSAFVAFRRHRFQLAAPDFNQCKFSGDKKPVQGDKRGDDGQFPEQNGRRIPTVGNYSGRQSQLKKGKE
jgi:hypothetical protein